MKNSFIYCGTPLLKGNSKIIWMSWRGQWKESTDLVFDSSIQLEFTFAFMRGVLG